MRTGKDCSMHLPNGHENCHKMAEAYIVENLEGIKYIIKTLRDRLHTLVKITSLSSAEKALVSTFAGKENQRFCIMNHLNLLFRLKCSLGSGLTFNVTHKERLQTESIISYSRS